MQKDSKIFKWIVVVVLVIVIYGATGIVSEILDINMRSARYLILAIFFLGCYIVDEIRNRKK